MKKISLVLLLLFGLTIVHPAVAMARTEEGTVLEFDTCRECQQEEESSDPDSTEITHIVRVTSPNGGETWGRKAGNDGEAIVTGTSLHIITWDTLTVGVKVVDILYSLDGGLTWNIIASKVDNTDSFDWILPNVDSDQALIRVRGFDADHKIMGSDDSNGTFTILNYIVDPAYESDVIDDYHFALVGVMAPVEVKQGEMIRVNLTIRNTGSATWHKYGNYPLHLGTTNPMDHVSQFASHDWLTPNRTTEMMEDEVRPGEVGTFQFTLFANNEEGTYKEYFKPVAEHLTWLNDELIVMTIKIV